MIRASEEIRRLADLCDGLAGPGDGSAERLKYRLSVRVHGNVLDTGMSIASQYQ